MKSGLLVRLNIFLALFAFSNIALAAKAVAVPKNLVVQCDVAQTEAECSQTYTKHYHSDYNRQCAYYKCLWKPYPSLLSSDKAICTPDNGNPSWGPC